MPRFPIEEISALAWGVLGALALLSVFAATVVLAKLMQFRRAGLGDDSISRTAAGQWCAGERAAALAAVREARGPRAALLRDLFETLTAYPGRRALAQARGTQRALEDLSHLGQNMRGLEAVVQSAPMLGLLGTVLGMIEAFGRLSQSAGAADPAELAGGIWTALITTALGLAIAILFYFFSLWLESRIAREREALDSLLAQVLGNEDQAAPGQAPASGAQTMVGGPDHVR